MLRKIVIFVALTIAPLAVRAANPIFGDFQNQFRADITWQVDHYAAAVRNFVIGYAQPNTFFRLPGRRSIHLGYMAGTTHWWAIEPTDPNARGKKIEKRCQHRSISTAMAGFMQDLVFLSAYNFYLGAGIGPYVKDHRRDFVQTNLIIGERAFLGYRFERFNVELIASHFSNGHLSLLNRGINSVGLGVTWNF
ncbi:MAG: acyloxyacyl hydrolase [Alphaproteobacteria bacterium]|nr:acyloxyacyl hydrolase [Alphaproteobacteria bacterium]